MPPDEEPSPAALSGDGAVGEDPPRATGVSRKKRFFLVPELFLVPLFIVTVLVTVMVLVYVFYFRLGWSPAPLGRLDVFYSAPNTVTGFYLIDTLIARDFEAFRSAFSQLILPATTLAIFSLAPIARMTRASMLAVLASDFAPVQGFVLTMAVMYVLLNLIVDILYGVIDPRVRLEG